jgi:hypothetical protein
MPTKSERENTRVPEPAKIFEQAECFYQALAVLRAVQFENFQRLRNSFPQIQYDVLTLLDPIIVLSAFTAELFLKCIILVEAGGTPRTHDLKELFDRLSEATRAQIENVWNTEIAVRRKKEWDDLERFLKVARDLPSALAKGSNAFDRIRYSHEGNTDGVHYYLDDLPTLLERLILEMKPEYEALRRMPLLTVPGTMSWACYDLGSFEQCE